MPKYHSAHASIIGQMLLCSFLWALSFLAIKQLGLAFTPLALTAIRGILGGGLLAVWIAFTLGPDAVLPVGAERRDWLALGLLQGLIPNVLTAFALTHINSGLTAMIQATAPLIVAGLVPIMLPGEIMTKTRLAGISVGFSGMMLLVGPAAMSSPVEMTGIAAMIATAFSYAFGVIYVRKAATTDPRRLALGQQIMSGVYAVILLVIWGEGDRLLPAMEWWPILIAFGVFGTALPIVIFMNILRRAGPTIGSMNGYFLPVWTILLGWMVMGETISPLDMTAIAIIFTGILLVTGGDNWGAAAMVRSLIRKVQPQARRG